MNEPRIGPSSVPAPPMIARITISTDSGIPNTAPGWSEKFWNA